ncbi:MAG: right-handed parallel beta-helix repeat-containing protein [Salinivirgaceae bacterium]|jgi:hypothetical protein|nr:right-handed parallel beta-helix repeat-containing protein [Salinivirgaceae bacterium]
MKFEISIIITLAVLLGYSCRDTENFSDNPTAMLKFSTDTVQFDTIFTSIGSTTHQFRFYNPNDKSVKTTISLAGGQNSYYRLNIDGRQESTINNYEILPHDSAYIFVEVNIDPLNSNSPLVVADSIMFFTNGNQQDVKLIAFGQDVHLYKDSVIDTRTWIADKPYLIYNSVLIDSDETLTVEAGTQIHFHNESAMWVLGSLNVQGTAENKVVFQGDRLDEEYQHIPGQWYGYLHNDSLDTKYLTGGIHFWQGSTNNIIDHAIVKNGVKGIQVDYIGESDNPTLVLSNSIIKNMSAIGLIAQTSKVNVINSVIANCGLRAVILAYGGEYQFIHSTIGNYYEFDSRKTESIIFNNYYEVDDKITAFDFSALFANSIIYGNLENELLMDLNPTDDVELGLLFDHCMIKLDDDFDTSNDQIFSNVIRHKDSLPNFTNTYEGDFRLDTLSAAKDKGSTIYSTLLPFDQDDVDRTLDDKPDLGAYERVEQE